MPKIVMCLYRKPTLTHAEYREYYERVHAPLGLEYFGHLWSEYRRNYIESVFGLDASVLTADRHASTHGAAAAHPDCITELVFHDDAALQEFYRIGSDPEIRAILAADEDRHLDRARSQAYVTDTRWWFPAGV